MKKRLMALLLTVVVLVLAVILFLLCGYWLSLRDRGAASLPALAVLTPEEGTSLGGELTAQLEFELPLYRRVEKVAVVPPEGVTVVGNPRISSEWRWSERRWRVEALLRPFRSGTMNPGALALEISPVEKGAEIEAVTVAIPDFSVRSESAVPGGELRLAGSVEPGGPDERKLLWLIPAVILLLLAAGLIYRWRRRAMAVPSLPPWEQALADLSGLKQQVDSRNITPEVGFFRLTDLVRGYLEKRFQLRVTTRTTPEFLSGLDRESVLPAGQRPFLRDFLTAADQIKFALAPTDAAAVDAAIERASALVEATRPIEEEKESENRVERGGEEKK